VGIARREYERGGGGDNACVRVGAVVADSVYDNTKVAVNRVEIYIGVIWIADVECGDEGRCSVVVLMRKASIVAESVKSPVCGESRARSSPRPIASR
jgi:hypothetical protein